MTREQMIQKMKEAGVSFYPSEDGLDEHEIELAYNIWEKEGGVTPAMVHWNFEYEDSVKILCIEVKEVVTAMFPVEQKKERFRITRINAQVVFDDSIPFKSEEELKALQFAKEYLESRLREFEANLNISDIFLNRKGVEIQMFRKERI